MKSKKIEFQGDKFFKIILAALIVYDLPPIIEGISQRKYSPLVQDIIGGGAGAIIGYLADDNTLFNASLAIAAIDYLNGFIAPEVDKILAQIKPAAPVQNTQMKKAATIQPALAEYYKMNSLNEYVGANQAGLISPFVSYREAYRSN